MTRLNDTNSLASVSAASTTSTTVRVVGAHSSTTARPSTAPITFDARVAEHQPLAQVVAEQSGERADDRRDRDADRVGRARSSAIGIHASSPTLIARPGARSKRFARFAASATSSASATTRAPGRAAPAGLAPTTTTASAHAADDLHQPGRDATVRERAEVAAEAVVGLRPDDVVEQAEQPEADAREQHQQAGRVAGASSPTPNAPNSDRPPSTSTTASTASTPIAVGDRAAPVVRARERGRAQHVVRRRRRAAAPSAARRRARGARSRRDAAGWSRSRPRRSRSARRCRPRSARARSPRSASPCGSSASSKVVTCLASAGSPRTGSSAAPRLGAEIALRRSRRTPRRAPSGTSAASSDCTRSTIVSVAGEMAVGAGDHEHPRRP